MYVVSEACSCRYSICSSSSFPLETYTTHPVLVGRSPQGCGAARPLLNHEYISTSGTVTAPRLRQTTTEYKRRGHIIVMADNKTSKTSSATAEETGSNRLAALRKLAQEHLQEIGQQDEKERLEEREVHAVLQEEAMRRGSKTRNTEAPATTPEDKGGRMRTAQGESSRQRFRRAILTNTRRARPHKVGSQLRRRGVCGWIPRPVRREHGDPRLAVAE